MKGSQINAGILSDLGISQNIQKYYSRVTLESVSDIQKYFSRV
jgi:hypothetical protein